MKVVSYLAQMQDQMLGTQFPVKKKVPLDHSNNKRDPFFKQALQNSLTINCFSSFNAISTACFACMFFIHHIHTNALALHNSKLVVANLVLRRRAK